MQKYQHFLFVLGRIIVGLIFLVVGINQAMHWQHELYHIAEQGMPYAALWLAIALACQILGGFCLILGIKVHLVVISLLMLLGAGALLFLVRTHFDIAHHLNAATDWLAHNIDLFAALLLLLAHPEY